MKKIVTLILAVVTSAVSLFAQSGRCGDNLTWSLYNDTLTISGNGDMTSTGWYSYKKSILSVVIRPGVTNIGWHAFMDCSGLTSVTIPNSVTSIGSSAFMDCSGLTSVTIPNSVTSIGEKAFYRCESLTSITCKASTPPTCGSSVFDGVDQSLVIYVPEGSVQKYKNKPQWSQFKIMTK